MPFLIIHGHFYQPPRENPWTGVIEEQPSAAPFHDWNERIQAECYQPNTSAVISNPVTGESRAINNYEYISFNFGPTLLSWLEQNHPNTYNQIFHADRASVLTHHGHGNAMAQAYGHAILPLCNDRDLRTQIRWGLADFRYRFGRESEAMWLPETACNGRVLDALIEEGLRYVILAPHQAARIRTRSERDEVSTGSGSDRVKDSTNDWHSVVAENFDMSIPYRYTHPDDAGKSIAVFFYHGLLSRAIAFEGLLRSSGALVDAFAQAARGKEMINLVTDGETYGHHFKFGDLCLAHALTIEAPSRGFKVTNYGEYLDQHPPQHDVVIHAGPDGQGTSWSCPHGVGRWLRDCGCATGGEPGWNQQWRKPLRDALDFLRDENIPHFEATRGDLFTFPWLARDDSISLILNPRQSREQFLFEHAGRWLSADERLRALTYLELQRMLLLMYTSCGWFFNDICGIETIQILRYSARAMDLMEQLNLPSARERFLEILSQAKSNRPELGAGTDIFRRFVATANPKCSGQRLTEEAVAT
jgi:alpha-amylase/alpha-mannosidase (GH57 family)